MEDEPKSERFNMFMSPSELASLDKWAWTNRIRSKSEAVRRLLQIGMRAGSYIPPILENSASSIQALAELNSEAADILVKGASERELAAVGALYLRRISEVVEGQILVQQHASNLAQEVLALLNEQEFGAALGRANETREEAKANLEKMRVAFLNAGEGVDE